MNPLIADISHWDDNPQTPDIKINWSLMASKLDGVIVKVGQGLAVDPLYEESWKKSKAVGMLRGSYWFYDSRYDPKKQAEQYAQLLGDDIGELPLFGDFEDKYDGKFHGWKYWYDFLEHLKTLVPDKEIGIYTNFYYWTENTVFLSIAPSSLNYFKQYPLWLAGYKTNNPLIPKPWVDYTFWQFTDHADGAEYGVEAKELDLSYFNGTMEEYQKRYGKEHQTERDVAYLRKAGREAKYKRI